MSTDKSFTATTFYVLGIIILSISVGSLVVSRPTETVKYKDLSEETLDVGIYLYEAGVQRGVYEALEEIIKYGAEDFDTKRVIDRAMKSLTDKMKETEK